MLHDPRPRLLLAPVDGARKNINARLLEGSWAGCPDSLNSLLLVVAWIKENKLPMFLYTLLHVFSRFCLDLDGGTAAPHQTWNAKPPILGVAFCLGDFARDSSKQLQTKFKYNQHNKTNNNENTTIT